jgi:hypothetical protein
LEDDPCQHQVRVNGKSIGVMDGPAIALLFVSYRQEIPDHFKEYVASSGDERVDNS